MGGSSPRSRGTHVHDAGLVVEPRFIPASAGNTPSGSWSRPTTPVHPRIRGEHHAWRWFEFRNVGSSPHPRGTLWSQLGGIQKRRFIPASAGNTWSWPPSARIVSVHPRIRGEHASNARRYVRSAGSSPHPRGTLRLRPGSGVPRRFIPASAGNTGKMPWQRAHLAVHPRIRGEHWMMKSSTSCACGSSPHPRGTRYDRTGRTRDVRFIPASAGNTCDFSSPIWVMAVHPRIRGEHAYRAACPVAVIGSSPHPRGTHRSGDFLDRVLRFIPASAGNTLNVTHCSEKRKTSRKILPNHGC